MTPPHNTIPHTDIKLDGWISFLPTKIRPYALLTRLDRPIGIWLLLLPSWWSIALANKNINFHTLYLAALFGLGAIIMRAAGCIVNDLWDRDLDRQVERTRNRPLASGTVTSRQALFFLFGLLTVGLTVLLQLPKTAIIFGFLTIPLIAAYPLMKRITWWPQAFLGIVFNFGALMGWAAVRNAIDPPALLLYTAGILWTLGYDTIYAYQDIEDDARIGIKSSARRLGKNGKAAVSIFYALCAVFLLAAQTMAQTQIFEIILGLCCSLHLVWQIHAWNPNDAKSSLRIFKSNRDFGFMILAAILVAS